MGWWWENVSVSIVFARPKKCNISSLWLVMDQTLLGKPQHVVCTVCIPHANKNNIYCNNRVKEQSHSTCTIPFILFMIHTENKHLYWFYSPFYESSLLPVALNTLDNFIACLALSDIFSVIPIVFPAPSLSFIFYVCLFFFLILLLSFFLSASVPLTFIMPSTFLLPGCKHVKGILLFGPPGCGKTLMARQIGKMLNAREPKVVNGPEILNKYVGESEANIRKLFAEAEDEQKRVSNTWCFFLYLY